MHFLVDSLCNEHTHAQRSNNALLGRDPRHPLQWTHTCSTAPNALLQGEILIRSANNFSGYYKAQDKTDEVLDKDGFFHTGEGVSCKERWQA
eukprot:1156147-Pelagomonas_calceolata.AAC.7